MFIEHCNENSNNKFLCRDSHTKCMQIEFKFDFKTEDWKFELRLTSLIGYVHVCKVVNYVDRYIAQWKS